MNKTLGTREIMGLLARLLAGGVFIYAGFLKAAAPAEEFAYAIEAYRIIPAGLTMFAAMAVPWIEVYLGVFLAAGVFTRYCALSVCAMILAFEGLLLQAILRKLPVTACGCFGASMNNSLGYEFSQNLLLLALTALAWKYGGKISIDSAVEKYG